MAQSFVGGTQENGVRRSPNGFILLSNANRSRIARENLVTVNREISKILGRLWNNLDQEERNYCVKRALTIRRQHILRNPGLYNRN
jgi:hypothetical protein